MVLCSDATSNLGGSTEPKFTEDTLVTCWQTTLRWTHAIREVLPADHGATSSLLAAWPLEWGRLSPCGVLDSELSC